MRRLLPFAILSALALAACDAPTAPGAPLQPLTGSIADPAKAVSATRALQLFDSVCGASLSDDFASATARMAKQGFTVASPYATGTQYSAAEDVSFKISDGPGFGKTCSMVFTSVDSQSIVTATMGQIGTFRSDPMFGRAALYRGQRRIVVFDTPSQTNGHLYYHLALFSDH